MDPLPQNFRFTQEMSSEGFEPFFYSDTRSVVIPVHTHTFYELFFFIDGRGGKIQYQAGDIVYELSPCDIIMLPPGLAHGPLFLKYPSVYRRVVLWFTDDYLTSLGISSQDLFAAYNPSAPAAQLYRFPPVISCYLFEIACTLTTEFYSCESYSRLLAHAHICQLLGLLGRYRGMQVKKESPLGCEQVINEVLFYINHHLSDSLTLDLLAEHFFISKFYLSRAFKSYMGVTIHQYISQRRLLWAKHLLSIGFCPTMIYKRCGFTNYSSFYRAFVSAYNMPPKSLCGKAQEPLPGITNARPAHIPAQPGQEL